MADPFQLLSPIMQVLVVFLRQQGLYQSCRYKSLAEFHITYLDGPTVLLLESGHTVKIQITSWPPQVFDLAHPDSLDQITAQLGAALLARKFQPVCPVRPSSTDRSRDGT